MMLSELQDRCNLDDCSGYVCEFHSLRKSAQKYIAQLEAENARLREFADMVLNGDPTWLNAYEALQGVDDA